MIVLYCEQSKPFHSEEFQSLQEAHDAGWEMVVDLQRFGDTQPRWMCRDCMKWYREEYSKTHTDPALLRWS